MIRCVCLLSVHCLFINPRLCPAECIRPHRSSRCTWSPKCCDLASEPNCIYVKNTVEDKILSLISDDEKSKAPFGYKIFENDCKTL